jgi:hypothetical protein
MAQLPCPYLKGDVELTIERERHIGERHPDLLPDHYDLMAATLAAPDLVRRSPTWETPGCFPAGLTTAGAANTWWSWW